MLVEKELLDKVFVVKLQVWKHSGFNIDNTVQILDQEAQENLSEYISRPPISLKKIRCEPFKDRVLFHTKYSNYFKENVHMFDALDFLAELTQQVPPKRTQLIRRYGLYSPRSLFSSRPLRFDSFREPPTNQRRRNADTAVKTLGASNR